MNNLVRHLDVLSSSPRRREIVEVASPDGTITTVTLMEPLIGGALSEILYPDPQQFAQAPAHYAVVNNRKDAEGQIVPYPVGLLSDVIAIELTVVPNEGDTPVERSTLYQLYDRDYILFNRLLAAAMRVTGLVQLDANPNSGQTAWDQVLKFARMAREAIRGDRHGDALEYTGGILGIATAALRDYKVETPEEDVPLDPSDRDMVLEGLVGNSETAQ